MNDDSSLGRPDPLMPMPDRVGRGSSRSRALTIAVFLLLGCCVIAGALVLLVLLGIIAEPETMIEQIGRWLLGR